MSPLAETSPRPSRSSSSSHSVLAAPGQPRWSVARVLFAAHDKLVLGRQLYHTTTASIASLRETHAIVTAIDDIDPSPMGVDLIHKLNRALRDAERRLRG